MRFLSWFCLGHECSFPLHKLSLGASVGFSVRQPWNMCSGRVTEASVVHVKVLQDCFCAQNIMHSAAAVLAEEPAGDAAATGDAGAWPDVRNFDSWQMQASLGAASDDALAAWTTFDDSPSRKKKMAARQRATPSAPRMPSWDSNPSHSQVHWPVEPCTAWSHFGCLPDTA